MSILNSTICSLLSVRWKVLASIHASFLAQYYSVIALIVNLISMLEMKCIFAAPHRKKLFYETRSRTIYSLIKHQTEYRYKQ